MTMEEFMRLDVDDVVTDSAREQYFVIYDADALGTASAGRERAVYAAKELDAQRPKHIRIDAENAKVWELAGRIVPQ